MKPPRYSKPPSPGTKNFTGFTLLELMVSAALLAILTSLLLGVTAQTASISGRTLAMKHRQQAARIVLETISRDLGAASSPVGTSQGGSLAFLVNPVDAGERHLSPGAAFWQARSAQSSSGFRDVGYFIRWTGAEAELCRLTVPSEDPLSIFRNTNRVIDSALLDRLAPAGAASDGNLRGLMADHVVGLWFKLLDATGAEIALPYDSRDESVVRPAFVDVGIAVMDPGTAAKIGSADEVRSHYTPSITEFLPKLPESIRAGVQIFTTRVRIHGPI
jgi:prepilin-type N-terminal cleavage/methylation domain-containing protein